MADELTRDELLFRLNKAEAFIAREGYRTCSAKACNCDSWHGGAWYRRYEEIREVAIDAGVKTNGVLLVDAIRDALSRRATPEPSEALVRRLHVYTDADFVQRNPKGAAETVQDAIAALRAAREKDNG